MKKTPWSRNQRLAVWSIVVPAVLAFLSLFSSEVRRFVRLEKPRAPARTTTQAETIPPASIPQTTPDTSKPKPPRKQYTTKPATQIEQRGTGNGAAGSIDQSGNCNINQIGGSGNQASVNCAPVERHLSEKQKAALKGLVVPDSISVTLTMTNEGDSQTYGREIADALNLPSANQSLGLTWSSPRPPQGTTVRIHDVNEPNTLQELGMTLGRILDAQGFRDDRVPTGVVSIVVGRVPSK
jgi:hypothetical protein